MPFLIALAAGLTSQLPDSGEATAAAATLMEATYADLEAAFGYATNPLLDINRNRNGQAFGRVSARVVHSRVTERSNTILSGYLENTTYSGRYPSQQLAELSVHHSFAASERLQLFGDIDAAADRDGQLATRLVFAPITADPAPVSPVLPPLLDPSLDYVTLTGRTYRFRTQAGVQVAASERDTWTASGGFGFVRRRSGGINLDERDIFGSSSYSRRLNERSSAGLLVSFQQVDYDGPAHILLVTPEVTGSLELSERTHLSGAVGISIGKFDDGTASHSSTGLAGNVALCHSGATDQICASASRNQQIAAGSGALSSLAANLSYSRRIGSGQTLQFAVGVSRYSNQVRSLDNQLDLAQSSFVASASYARKLSDRWSAGANLSARKISRAGPDPRTDLSGSIFIRYRLGDLF